MNTLLLMTLLAYMYYNERRYSKVKKSHEQSKKEHKSIIEDFKVEVKRMVNTTIRFRRGVFKNLPTHGKIGEPFYSMDCGILSIGNGDKYPMTHYVPNNIKIPLEVLEDPNFKPLTIDTESNEVL